MPGIDPISLTAAVYVRMRTLLRPLLKESVAKELPARR